MNYYHIYTIALFSCLIGLHQPITYGMQYAQKFAQIMKISTTLAFFAASCNRVNNKYISCITDNLDSLQEADPGVIKFAQETLQKYGYSESFSKSIKFVPYHKFGSYNEIIFIPISEQELKDEYSKQDMLIPQQNRDLHWWQCTILHEASHVDCHDSYKRLIGSFLFPLAVHYSGKKIATSLQSHIALFRNAGNVARGFATLPCLVLKLATTYCLDLALGKYQECRADYNIIKRVNNPVILETQALIFDLLHKNGYQDKLQALEKLRDSSEDASQRKMWDKECQILRSQIILSKKYPWLEELWDEHPRCSVRRDYFTQAAQNLRKKMELHQQ